MLMALPMSNELDPAERTARIIRSLLGASGLDQKDLAEAIGWKPPTMSKALKGQRQWKARDLEAIAKFFDVGVGTLFMDPDELLTLIRTGRFLTVIPGDPQQELPFPGARRELAVV